MNERDVAEAYLDEMESEVAQWRRERRIESERQREQVRLASLMDFRVCLCPSSLPFFSGPPPPNAWAPRIFQLPTSLISNHID
jgi:hypothetical protein